MEETSRLRKLPWSDIVLDVENRLKLPIEEQVRLKYLTHLDGFEEGAQTLDKNCSTRDIQVVTWGILGSNGIDVRVLIRRRDDKRVEMENTM